MISVVDSNFIHFSSYFCYFISFLQVGTTLQLGETIKLYKTYWKK